MAYQIKAVAATSNGNILCLPKNGSPDLYLFKHDFQKYSALTRTNLETPDHGSFSLEKEEISYFYFRSHYSLFNSLEDSLLNNNIPKEQPYTKALESEFTVFPHSWNLLHIASIEGNSDFIKNMPAYRDFKLRFILDHYFKTPLHYLLAHQEINYSSVNIILAYICDYMEAANQYEYQQIIKSLSPLLGFILQKCNVRLRENFLNLCSTTSATCYNLELPNYGSPLKKTAHFASNPQISPALLKKLCKKGQEDIHFRTNALYLDYNVASNDMNMAMKSIQTQNDEKIFQTNAVTGLVDHLWKQSQIYLMMNFIIFSVFIISLSVYIGLQQSHKDFEAALLVYSGVLLFGELLKVSCTQIQYFYSPWRILELMHLMLTIAFVATRITEKGSSLGISWVSTIIILVGYLIWMTHFRIIKPLRKLFVIIMRIARDMITFVVVIALTIVAFAIVFLVFEIGGLEETYGFHLYNSYASLYGTIENSIESSLNVSQKLILAAIAFILNVLFLHLLIPFMSESYNKVLKEKFKTETLTKLAMILNVSVYIRFCQKIMRGGASRKGYLVYCLPGRSIKTDQQQEINGKNETGKLMKEWLEKSEEMNNKGFANLRGNIGENMESLQESIKGLQLAEYEYQRMRDQVDVMKQKNLCLEEFHGKIRELIEFEVIKGKNTVIKALDDVIMNCNSQEANIVKAGDFTV